MDAVGIYDLRMSAKDTGCSLNYVTEKENYFRVEIASKVIINTS